MLRNTEERMAIRDFRAHVSRRGLQELLAERSVVEVGRYATEVDAVIVSPSEFGRLASSAEQLDALHESIDFLLTAAVAGIPIPSETLARLGLGVIDEGFDWQALNRLQRQRGVVVSHDDREAPLREVTLDFAPVDESDAELSPSPFE